MVETFRASRFDTALNRCAAVLGIVGFIDGVRRLLQESHSPPVGLIQAASQTPALSGPYPLYELCFVGILIAGTHAVLWSRIERILGWKFGGGGTRLPKGWQAVVLSLTMTLPLVLVPPVFQWLSGNRILLPRHFGAGFVLVIAAACGHLFLYGSRVLPFAGVRNVLMPMRTRPSMLRAAFMELMYACVHFGSIATLLCNHRHVPPDEVVFLRRLAVSVRILADRPTSYPPLRE